MLHISGNLASATGQETPRGFRVFKDSIARAAEVKSIHTWLSELRADLQKNGVLANHHLGLRFTQDYVFDSPSAAAGVLLGRATNGRTEWRSSDDKTLKSLQEQALQDVG